MTVSYPRRQQLRRLMRAAKFAGGAMITSIAAVLLGSAGYAGLAVPLGAVAVVFGLLSRRALRLPVAVGWAPSQKRRSGGFSSA